MISEQKAGMTASQGVTNANNNRSAENTRPNQQPIRPPEQANRQAGGLDQLEALTGQVS